MTAELRRNLLVLFVAVVMSGAVYVASLGPAGGEVPAGAGAATNAGAPATKVVALPSAPEVHLEALETARPGPNNGGRDLFRFRPRLSAVPTRPAPATSAGLGATPVALQPPPIPLRFIGIVQSAQSEIIAVLSDGRGTPIYGREGESVLGQYRIVRIGSESIEMAHLDGQGRQTIRLSGS